MPKTGPIDRILASHFETERTLPETIYRGEDPRRHKDGTIG